MKTLLTFCLLVTVLLPIPVAATAEEPAAETPCADEETKDDTELKAEVPELHAFHEVIRPLWHEAWPNRDFDLMRELLPEVQNHVKAIRTVELPGILRDKQRDWEKGVAALTSTLTAYEQAAADGDEDGLMDAVETIHANFETLMRTVRPVMKELGDYHVELYKIYHRHVPDRDLEGLRVTALALAQRCDELAGAEIPRWFEGKRERLEAGFQDLCHRTDALNEVLTHDGWDHILEAVESVHDHYMKVEHMFD